MDAHNHWVNVKHKALKILTTKGLLLALAFQLFLSSKGMGFDLNAGIGLIEEGDDRWQLATKLEAITKKGWKTDVAYSSLSYGPVLRSQTIVATGPTFKLFYPRHLRGQVGLAILNETVQFNFEEAQAPNDTPLKDEQYNFGFLYGVHWRSDSRGLWQYGFSWESAYFLAGPAAGLFLSTGRKQLLTFVGGLRF